VRAFALWKTGVRTGLSSMKREPILGLKRVVLPVSYWRTAEFSYVWEQLAPVSKMRVLDLGSPKELALFLARDVGCEVVAVDILESAIEVSRRYAIATGRDGSGPGHVRSEVQDGRALPYADNSFDAAFSVSVLEHIPDDGDSLAIKELARVVRPGGVIVVTTPFDLQHRDTFVQRTVYERSAEHGEPVFFERHYDHATLRARLLDTAGTRVEDLQLWGERGIEAERVMGRLGRARMLLSPFEALLASSVLRRSNAPALIKPKAAFFTLRKVLA
jgi:SAM-dependent methyltransferase